MIFWKEPQNVETTFSNVKVKPAAVSAASCSIGSIGPGYVLQVLFVDKIQKLLISRPLLKLEKK
jgi:hypothetical protein